MKTVISPKLIAMIESSLKDIEKGDVSPKFSNAKDAIKWLNTHRVVARKTK